MTPELECFIVFPVATFLIFQKQEFHADLSHKNKISLQMGTRDYQCQTLCFNIFVTRAWLCQQRKLYWRYIMLAKVYQSCNILIKNNLTVKGELLFCNNTKYPLWYKSSAVCFSLPDCFKKSVSPWHVCVGVYHQQTLLQHRCNSTAW